MQLLVRAGSSRSATTAFPPGEMDDSDIETRLLAGDRLAIYDAVIAAANRLERLSRELSEVLAEDPDAMARLAELRACKRAGICTATICSGRWNNASATECSGKSRGKPRRSVV